MKKIIEIIKDSVSDNNYKTRVGLLEGIQLHSSFDKTLVSRLLSKTFPSEDASIKRYRESVFLPITKTYFDKVLHTIKRVYSSDEFSFSTGSKKLERFLDEPFTGFQDFFNWLFSAGLKHVLEDANGYFVVLPQSVWFDLDLITSNEDLIYTESDINVTLNNESVVKFFDSSQVIFDNGFGTIVVKYSDGWLHITKHKIDVYTEKTLRNSTEYEVRTLVDISAIKNAPSLMVRSTGNYISFNLYESFISGVCPYWTQALIEFSDKQGALKEHVNPVRWRYSYGACNVCNGTGSIIFSQPDGTPISSTCGTCNGQGKQPSGVYSEIVIEKDFFSGEVKPPFMGYIEKDLKPVEFISNDISENIYNGLSAINMEFLMDTPLNQSGTAKEIDKSDVNHFIKLVGNYLIDNIAAPIIKNIYFFKAYFDSEMLGLIKQEDDGMVFNLPEIQINLPQNMDYTGTNSSEKMLLDLINSNMNQNVKKEAEIRYLRKKFISEKFTAELLIAKINLDTLYGLTLTEKLQMFSAGAITRKELDISNNLGLYINIAINENGKSFLTKDIEEQLQIINSIYEKRSDNEGIQKIPQ